jgi:murein DD-endopeptidase MepM/ murein hydrolase activator NlpD
MKILKLLLLSSLLCLISCSQDMAVVEYKDGVPKSSRGNNNDFLWSNSKDSNITEATLDPLTKETVQEENHASENKPSSVEISNDHDGFFSWPVNGLVVDKFAEMVDGRKNDGINIVASKGTEVHPTRDGKVVYVGNEIAGYGNLIIIKHDNGWLSAYGNLDKILVQKNEQVKEQSIIGLVGEATDKNGDKIAQLHFALRKTGKKPEDPLKYLPRKVDY